MPLRRSRRIGYKGAQTLYYAIGEQAQRIGLPLTQYVTINFTLAGVEPQNAVAMFRALRSNHFTKWAQRPGRGKRDKAFQPAFAFYFENERDGTAFTEVSFDKPHNVHVHWLVHVPGQRLFDFSCRLRSWLDGLCNHLTPEGAIDITAITDIRGLRKYGLKGTDQVWARHFGADHEDQGLIVGGRRTGTSLNLGPSARKRLDKVKGVRRRAA